MQLHQLNRGFDWRSPRSTPRLLSPTAVAQFDREGFLLIDRAFPESAIAALRDDVDRWEAESEAFLRTMPDGEVSIAKAGAITFTVHLVTRSNAARAFSLHRVFRDICFDLIGPDVRLYWDQAVYKKPEPTREFPWHQDNGYTFVEPQQYLTCWVPLTDATTANGCPWVVPGFHRYGTLVHRDTKVGFQCLDQPEGAIAIEAPVGSVVVFSSLTPHRTGPNTTGSTRKAYILQYAPDGAEAIRGEAGEVRERQDNPQRQYALLSGGEPVDS